MEQITEQDVHTQSHKRLYEALLDLSNDYLEHTGFSQSETSVETLLKWAYNESLGATPYPQFDSLGLPLERPTCPQCGINKLRETEAALACEDEMCGYYKAK